MNDMLYCIRICDESGDFNLTAEMLAALELSGYRLDLSGCAGCGALLAGKCFFDVADGCFYCADCARGAGVSAGTLEVLKKCAGEECDPAKVTREGKRRAVKLLYAFFRAKTETEVKALAEYIALPQ